MYKVILIIFFAVVAICCFNSISSGPEQGHAVNKSHSVEMFDFGQMDHAKSELHSMGISVLD